MGSRAYSTYVPSTGNPRAKIMIVGEAPGANEEEQLQPFVGDAGKLLTRYLGRHRVRRDEVFMTNLCKFRPVRNKFINLFESGHTPGDELAAGLEELKSEIESVKPNIIIAAGNWPMWFLTGCSSTKGEPGAGISYWRGSVVPCTLVENGPKVLVTYHPSFIVRAEGFSRNPIFNFDLGKGITESHTPDLCYPVYKSHIDPPENELQLLVDELVDARQISTDIETFGDRLACVGFAGTTEWGLCMTHNDPRSWEVSEYLLSRDTPKVMQYGAFDINYLDRFYRWQTHGYGFKNGKIVGWDTYLAAATLMPEFPRGLDFLASIYTRFPFYKEERKTWKETNNQTILWEYNIKDVIATLMIAEEQQKEVKGVRW